MPAVKVTDAVSPLCSHVAEATSCQHGHGCVPEGEINRVCWCCIVCTCEDELIFVVLVFLQVRRKLKIEIKHV